MNKIKNKLELLLTLFVLSFKMNAQVVAYQDKNVEYRDLIQFSGVVVEADSLKPIPYVNIMIKGTYRGTVSDYFGYFSFVTQKGDTVEFSSVGYKKVQYIIPDTLKDNKYSLIQVMRRDTVYLKETVIYPWPTKEQFRDAFLKLEIPNDDLKRAEVNLARAEAKDRMMGPEVSGSINFKNSMEKQNSRLYYAGQLPPNNLLNPIAWAKFIQAWKNGDFKSKDKD